jgi:hypothetical protein
MDSTIHTHIAALYIQDRIAVAAGERQAREVVRSRAPRRRSLRSPWRRPVVSVPRTLRT